MKPLQRGRSEGAGLSVAFVHRSTGDTGRSRVDELKASGKPFQISKEEVWDAWIKVKGNKGAPGVDGQCCRLRCLHMIWRRSVLMVRLVLAGMTACLRFAAGSLPALAETGPPARRGRWGRLACGQLVASGARRPAAAGGLGGRAGGLNGGGSRGGVRAGG